MELQISLLVEEVKNLKKEKSQGSRLEDNRTNDLMIKDLMTLLHNEMMKIVHNDVLLL